MIRFTILFLAFFFSYAFSSVFANDEKERNYKYEEKFRTLQKEIDELKEHVKKLTGGQAENKTKIVENETEIVAAKPQPHTDFDVPSLNIRGFGDFRYNYVDQSFRDSTSSDSNHFANGEVGLLVFSQISEKLSFLSETLFEFETSGETEFDIERVLLKYEYADWLNISIGRDHTPIGYWNQHYHHASWTHTTIDRPLIFRFEGDDGILPMHYVGIGLSGNVGFDFGNVGYNLTIGNGRGKDTKSIQLVNDLNDDKEISFQFTVEPKAIEGFGFGANILYDVIPYDIGVVGRESEIDEVIAGAHLYYTADPFEIIAEYQYIWHDDLRSTKSHHGGYMQLGYSFDKVKPYYRFGILDIDSNDAYFTELEDATNSIQHTVGVRYDWFPFAAIKVEYRRLDTNYVDSNEISTQISFMY